MRANRKIIFLSAEIGTGKPSAEIATGKLSGFVEFQSMFFSFNFALSTSIYVLFSKQFDKTFSLTPITIEF